MVSIALYFSKYSDLLLSVSPSSTATTHDNLDVDELILMHMEKEWGMREMARYKTVRGAWPLRSELKGYNDEETKAALRGANIFQEEEDVVMDVMTTFLNSLPKIT